MRRQFDVLVRRCLFAAAVSSCLFVSAATAQEQWPPPQPAPQQRQPQAQPRIGLWDAATIASAPSTVVSVAGPDKKPVARISVARVKLLVDAQKKIEARAGTTARLLIQEGTSPNAASAPTPQGNMVAVNLAMLDFIGDDADEYAAVLGHEYAHLTLGHRASRQQREQVRSGVSTLLGFALSLAGVPMSGTISSLGTSAVSLIYSRDEERDADGTGLRYAAEAGFDPGAAARLWKRMADRGGNRPVPFLSSHPAPSERMEYLTTQAQALKRSQPAAAHAASTASKSPPRPPEAPVAGSIDATAPAAAGN